MKSSSFDKRLLVDSVVDKLLDYLGSCVESWLERTALNIMPQSSLNEEVVTNNGSQQEDRLHKLV